MVTLVIHVRVAWFELAAAVCAWQNARLRSASARSEVARSFMRHGTEFRVESSEFCLSSGGQVETLASFWECVPWVALQAGFPFGEVGYLKSWARGLLEFGPIERHRHGSAGAGAGREGCDSGGAALVA